MPLRSMLIVAFIFVGVAYAEEIVSDKVFELLVVCNSDGSRQPVGAIKPVPLPFHHTYSTGLENGDLADQACMTHPKKELRFSARVVGKNVTRYPEAGWGDRSGMWNTETRVRLLEYLGEVTNKGSASPSANAP